MKMSHLYALCDEIAAAVLVAEPSWSVHVVTDAQVDVKDIPATGVELHIGPDTNEETRGREDAGGASRKRADATLSIMCRMRCKLNRTAEDTVARDRAVEWDKVVDILQRRAGFVIDDAGTASWDEGAAFIDPMALRQDRVVSVVASTKFLLFRKIGS